MLDPQCFISCLGTNIYFFSIILRTITAHPWITDLADIQIQHFDCMPLGRARRGWLDNIKMDIVENSLVIYMPLHARLEDLAAGMQTLVAPFETRWLRSTSVGLVPFLAATAVKPFVPRR
jgi:hypothetical protein